MRLVDFTTLCPDDAFFVPLDKSVWLMDDHRWAILAWESQWKYDKYCLVHADYHWDAVYDFHGRCKAEEDLLAADYERMKQYVIENELIRFDSFIAPAVRRGMFADVHFFCEEGNSNEIGLDENLLTISATKQVIHDTIETLVASKFSHPIIFDLCLDLFNYSDEWETGDLWPESNILDFINSVSHIIAAAEVVTISLSFGYSGTVEDTRRLARLVLPKILACRSGA